MKNKFSAFLILLCLLATVSKAQYNNRNVYDDEDEYGTYFKIGTQIPFQHSLIYDHRITPTFSINGGLGLVTSPYTGLVLSTLENKNVITSNDRNIIDRSFKMGITYQVGANFHFQNNYVRAYGQLMHLRGDLAITDLANLYLRTNLPSIGRLLNPIEVRSNVPMIGLLYGRRFAIGERSEIHAEASIAKSLSHNTSYKTGTIIDNLEVVNDILYTGLDNDFDRYYNKYGWFPSINVYYVYKF